MNILFTCAGRRNYLLRFFKDEVGTSGRVLAADMDATAPALQEADEFFLVPEVGAENYIPILLEICANQAVKLIVSLNDVELPLLSENEKAFEQVGTRVLVSGPDVIDICFDKLKTCDFLSAHEFDFPLTYVDLDSATTAVREGAVQFPLFVKPRWGSASLQLYRVHSQEELALAFKLARTQLQKTFLKVNDDVISEAILIQEALPGDEYGIDILNDLEGNFQSVYVKRKLGMRAGETEKSSLIDEQILSQLGRRLGESLRHIGNLDCDVFYDGIAARVLEMNPRFGGGYPFSHAFGANYPKAIIEWCRGKTFNTSEFNARYGTVVSKCDNLIELG